MNQIKIKLKVRDLHRSFKCKIFITPEWNTIRNEKNLLPYFFQKNLIQFHQMNENSLSLEANIWKHPTFIYKFRNSFSILKYIFSFSLVFDFSSNEHIVVHFHQTFPFPNLTQLNKLESIYPNR